MPPAEEAKEVIRSSAEIENERERAGRWLAASLMIIFGLTVLSPVAFWLWRGQAPSPDLLTYVKDIAGLETTLLGATVAFYFSQRRLGGRQ
jgi:hypothetical protein